MAVGYFTRAASRATSIASSMPAAPVRPATPISSPLVDEDQRFNLTTPSTHGPDTDATSPSDAIANLASPETASDQETHQQEGPTAFDPPPLTPTPAEDTPDLSQPPDPAQTRHLTDPPTQPAAAQNKPATRVDIPEATGDGATFIPAQDPAHPAPEAATDTPSPKENTPRRPAAPPPASNMMKALAAAEKWVAGEPDPTDPLVPDGQRSAPPTPISSSDVDPVLPESPEPSAPSEPRQPLVQIGNIEVEVVAPPAPQKAPQTPRSAPAKTPLKPAMQFGWRQR